AGGHVYRVAPTGAALGRAAAAFVRDQLAPRLRRTQPLRYAVAYVDDVYGRSVGGGAIAEIRASRLPMAATFPYTLRRLDYDALAANIARARPDVLMVAAYLEDGVALRRSLVRARVPLVASIGTSSSYCMPAFGQMLGRQAVGVFASDKPDGDNLQPDRLLPGAARELRWATAEYRRRYGEPMTAPALAGFAGGLALFEHVLPRAHGFSAEAVAQAARAVRLPEGALPNGGGRGRIPFRSGAGPHPLRRRCSAPTLPVGTASGRPCRRQPGAGGWDGDGLGRRHRLDPGIRHDGRWAGDRQRRRPRHTGRTRRGLRGGEDYSRGSREHRPAAPGTPLRRQRVPDRGHLRVVGQ